MHLEELREFCLSLPNVTECFPFDDVSLVLKVHGKMFGLIPLDMPELSISLKCEPEKAISLREQYDAITPAFHFNKKHWNTLWIEKAPNELFIKEQIRHSYKQVVMKLPLKLRPTYTATIGFFDGVHCGHQYLLNELHKCAAQRGQQSLVITFDQHPRKVLDNDFHPKLLTDTNEKTALLHKQHIDEIELLHFTSEMAELTAQEFMNKVLKKQLNVKTLLLGYDHRFGSDKLPSFADYEKIGKKIGIEIIPQKQHTHKGEHISSSAIRNLIEQGNMQQANVLLGRPYSLQGVVTNGYKIGTKIGFPTANIQPTVIDKLIPQVGVYAVEVEVNKHKYIGMLNIGIRPTVHANHTTPSIEVHILNFDQDIYTQTIRIFFLKRLRKEQKFDTIEQLTYQLEKDKEEVQKIAKYINQSTKTN